LKQQGDKSKYMWMAILPWYDAVLVKGFTTKAQNVLLFTHKNDLKLDSAVSPL